MTTATPTKEQSDYERGQRAVASFHRLQPNLEAFARIFTGNKKVMVLPTGGVTRTDGRNIYLRVSIEMGDEHRHQRERCQERDAFGMLTCQACEVRELVLVSLFHEIAHIAYDSFVAMSDRDKENAVEKAVEEAERWGVKGKRLELIRRSMKENPPQNYAEASARISPFLQPLINGLEDARINVLTMKARPGMEPMFLASAKRIFERGLEQPDGSFTFWSEAPENLQVSVAASQYAMGHYEESWFSDDVAEALRDPDLQSLLKQASYSGSTARVYELAFPILEKLRSLGFCRAENEPEEDEPLQNEDGPNESDDGAPDQEDTGGDNDDEGGEEADSDDEEGDGAGGSGSGSQDESDDDGAGDDTDEADDEDEAGAGGAGDDTDESDDDGAGGAGDDTDESDDDGADGDDRPGGEGDEEIDHPGDEESDEQDPDQLAGTGSKENEGEGDDAPDRTVADDEADDEESEAEAEPQPDRGTAEDVMAGMGSVCRHMGDDHEDEAQEASEPEPGEAAVDIAIVQGRDFDEPSKMVYETRVFEDGGIAVKPGRVAQYPDFYGALPVPEQIIQQSLGRMRYAFSENRKGSKRRNLKSGKVNAKVLGRRVPVDDVRLFQKRQDPGRRDYFVVIGIDVSGSTSQRQRIRHIKAAALAQAELLSRVGIPFEVWAHACDGNGAINSDSMYGEWLETQLYKIKTVNEPWDTKARSKVEALVPTQANLDGHTMEFYRKRLDRSQATDRILMYYTDGDMPYCNYTEELRILKRELKECEKRGYVVVGVGFQTDSPTQHGLPTVRIDEGKDVHLVVEELRKRLAG